MIKKKTTTPKYVTPQILKREINRLDTKIDGVEKRLDTKIETSTQSMKDYTDSRFNRSDARTDALDAKMTKYFELMMQMISGFQKEIKNILTNHEERITVLEGKESG